MRIRKESGDFDIVLSEGTATIRAGLSPAALLGYVVDASGVLSVITEVTPEDGGCSFTIGETEYTYTKATGAIAAAD